MKVFMATNVLQSIKIRARTLETSVRVILRNELINETFTKDLQEGVLDDEFLELSVQHDFKEFDEYEITVLNSADNIIWRGKGFVTNQTDLPNYKIGNE